ncbi:hypothetical protein [uncultured Litoreibacter sp.]|uniref:hypothetical protein n=1 Tax=uncultured Litoreibacter sp. TaxID=1392394 RepID=UPI002606E777|nr:hypothetical protein [uncultured Litoreibacter sp.]
MITLLGLGLAAPTSNTTETPEPVTSISIADFSRDKTLFDSGAAFGRNEATVPIGGTATAGETVQVRVLTEGGPATAWSDLTMADGNGDWTGSVSAARSAGWSRIEVRNKSEPVTRATTANRFGVGHVVALWGQSEIVRIRSTAYNNLTPEPLLADDAVQAIWFDGAPVVKHLTDADPHTAALAAMANVFLAERPDDKVALVFQAVSGTGFRALVDDSDTSRNWSEDAAVHTFATADGQHVGLPSVSWFASPGSLAEHYEEALLPLFAGKTTSGADVTFPAQISFGSGGSYQADHWFGELYDPAQTKWVAFGPHRFDIDADMQSATVLAGGAIQNNLQNKEQARVSWRALMDNPHADGIFLPLGLEPTTYQNGVSDGSGGWTDQSHPSSDTDDGAPMFARLVAHAILQSSGLTNWSVPVFDMAEWEPSGAYVDVWSSAGPVTTTRSLRGEPELDNSQPHWTDVFGWQINGLPAHRAELENGRVRIYPNAGNFVSTDVIRFGEGGATGMAKFPEDHIAGTYKNLPVVDLGLAGVDGIPVRPLPDASMLANTLTPPAGGFSTGPTGPFFYDPATLGAGVSGLFAQMDLAPVVSSSGSKNLLTTTGNYLRLEILPNGKVRLRVRDSGGVVHVDNVQSGAVLADNVQADIRFGVDLPAGFARVWVNDALVIDESFSSATPTLPSNRALLLLASNTGAYQVEGAVSRLAIWKTATSDGSLPAATPYKDFIGPAAVVNADPWRNGTAAT